MIRHVAVHLDTAELGFPWRFAELISLRLQRSQDVYC